MNEKPGKVGSETNSNTVLENAPLIQRIFAVCPRAVIQYKYLPRKHTATTGRGEGTTDLSDVALHRSLDLQNRLKQTNI